MSKIQSFARPSADHVFMQPQSRIKPPRDLRMADLFAGVGGFRLAFESQGFRTVFTSEWNKSAQETYHANFGELPAGDICTVDALQMPDFDLLCAGFPCQPFSIAGVSKKNALGRPHGFADETQGTLFFEILRILHAKKPRAFLLENVKNLKSHDGGRTFDVICERLTEAGYHVRTALLNARAVLPQNRERIFIAGFRSRSAAEAFRFPLLPDKQPALRDILEKKVEAKYMLTDGLWKYLQEYKKKHAAAGHGFGFGLTPPGGIARTLSARYYKDGSEILVPVRGKNPRRLTPRECARLMGFPDSFKIVVSDTQAYKQFGNSVAVPVVRAIAKEMRKVLEPARQKAARDVLSHTVR